MYQILFFSLEASSNTKKDMTSLPDEYIRRSNIKFGDSNSPPPTPKELEVTASISASGESITVSNIIITIIELYNTMVVYMCNIKLALMEISGFLLTSVK